jgi:hypothetical protein
VCSVLGPRDSPLVDRIKPISEKLDLVILRQMTDHRGLHLSISETEVKSPRQKSNLRDRSQISETEVKSPRQKSNRTDVIVLIGHFQVLDKRQDSPPVHTLSRCRCVNVLLLRSVSLISTMLTKCQTSNRGASAFRAITIATYLSEKPVHNCRRCKVASQRKIRLCSKH